MVVSNYRGIKGQVIIRMQISFPTNRAEETPAAKPIWEKSSFSFFFFGPAQHCSNGIDSPSMMDEIASGPDSLLVVGSDKWIVPPSFFYN